MALPEASAAGPAAGGRLRKRSVTCSTPHGSAFSQRSLPAVALPHPALRLTAAGSWGQLQRSCCGAVSSSCCRSLKACMLAHFEDRALPRAGRVGGRQQHRHPANQQGSAGTTCARAGPSTRWQAEQLRRPGRAPAARWPTRLCLHAACWTALPDGGLLAQQSAAQAVRVP